MKGLKPTLVSAVAIGLLAGSAVGVAAQDEAADPVAPSAFSGAASGGPDPSFSTDPVTGLDLMVIPSTSFEEGSSHDSSATEDRGFGMRHNASKSRSAHISYLRIGPHGTWQPR